MNLFRPLTLLLFGLDLIAWLSVFFMVSWWRVPHLLHQDSYGFLLLPLGLLWLCLYLIDGYREQTDMMSLTYTSEHIVSVAVACLMTLFVSFILLSDDFPLLASRGVILASFIGFVPVSLAYRRTLYHRQLRHKQERLFLFIGSVADCERFNEIFARLQPRKKVVFASLQSQTAQASPVAIVPLTPQLLSDCQPLLDGIIGAAEDDTYPEDILQEMIRLRFKSIPIFTLESFYESHLRRIPLQSIDSSWLLKQGFQLASEPVFARIKRLSDLLLSSAALVLFLPLFLVAGIAIHLENSGPVFFRQRRLGRNLKPFTIIKFRTMAPSPEGTESPPVQNFQPTPVGAILRSWRIDELPQLWNVLVGDMSLIGPRAEWDQLAYEYQKQLSIYNFRLLVKPGITGWAQVNLPHGTGREHTMEKLEYDFYYIRHFSFLLDASIILKTLQTMLAAKGR